MSLFTAIDVAATSLEAQSARLNTISSNLANAQSVSSTESGVYRPRYPVFETILDEVSGARDAAAGVRVSEIVESDLPARREFAPDHPLADADGFIYRGNVDSVSEMVNMMQASRSYQASIEAMNTAKQMILRTLTLGR
jgi:flagellar basal-body rod protein FlgC